MMSKYTLTKKKCSLDIPRIKLIILKIFITNLEALKIASKTQNKKIQHMHFNVKT